jgi:LPPG:FO 2-phospho-L-lactate transferase
VELAGGTGGAKLARGLLDAVDAPEELVVIANTGDDVEIYGGYVSPDPDLITYWLADRIDARGWGIRDDTFAVMDGLRELGVEVWFNLGDRDLAVCLERARRLAGGERLTEVHQVISESLGVRARVLPMSDSPVRTRVLAGGRSWSLQEYLIVSKGDELIEDVSFAGAAAARPTPEVLEAIASARAVVIGPSNPIISIGPILALPGLREALSESPAPVVAVSPVVGGQILKGPTAGFLDWAGFEVTAGGIAGCYAGVIDGLVADERTGLVPVLETDVLMADAEGRRRLALQTLSFAAALG